MDLQNKKFNKDVIEMISCGFEPLMIARFSLKAAHSHSKNTLSSRVEAAGNISSTGQNFLLKTF